MRILITGGCGFVGSSLARLFNQHSFKSGQKCEVVVFDNLKRRGSELNLASFKREGISFVHGDIRQPADFESLDGQFDLFVEASAEPSVHAGVNGGVRYLFDTNTNGTINCLEYAKKHSGAMIFLSTSRVYPIPTLRALPLCELPTRLWLEEGYQDTGISAKGVSETLAVTGNGYRSLYGTSKLSSELIVEEYVQNFNFPAIVNRCGVIAGPGQFGKTDQGVFTLWVARHLFDSSGKLSYTGFGGSGKQVRDLLHPADLFNLLIAQIDLISDKDVIGQTYCVGGGAEGATSLVEYTDACRAAAGRSISIGSNADTAAVDVPWLVMDSSRARQQFSWQPLCSPAQIALEIAEWLKSDETNLRPLFS